MSMAVNEVVVMLIDFFLKTLLNCFNIRYEIMFRDGYHYHGTRSDINGRNQTEK